MRKTYHRRTHSGGDPTQRNWSAAASTCGSRANASLRDPLMATGLTSRLGAEHIYPSVRAAVAAYRAQSGAVPC